MEKILRIEGVKKNFGGVVALDDFSMTQDKNEIVGIIGPNGAGKTTAFNLITGVYSVDTGKIFFMDRDITNAPLHTRAELGIARTYQNIRLFPNLSVLNNVKVAYSTKVRYTIWEEMLRLPRVKREEKLVDEKSKSLLDYFNLSRYVDSQPDNLPYGLQRRLELARALMTNPKLLLLDEPAAGLNPHEVRSLIETIRRIQEDNQLSIVIVEHHIELIMNICSRVHVLDFGKRIAVGTPDEIKKDENVIRAYLGGEK